MACVGSTRLGTVHDTADTNFPRGTGGLRRDEIVSPCYVHNFVLHPSGPDSGATVACGRRGPVQGLGERAPLCGSTFEALSVSLFSRLPPFDMVSAFPAHTINNRAHGNKSHHHNTHSFQSIIHRMYTSIVMKRQALKSHLCPERSCHSMSLRAAWETLGSLNAALIIFSER